MTLSVPPTLAEVRLAAATRVSMGSQVRNSNSQHDLIDEYIRSSFNLLVREAPWALLNITEDITMVQGQHAYDVPTHIAPGDIEEVAILDMNNNMYPLTSGVSVWERSYWRHDHNQNTDPSEQVDMPLKWEIIDGQFMVYPAPDAERFPRVSIRGRAIPREPTNDTDRVAVDKESIVLSTVVALKTYFKKDASYDVAVLNQHLKNIGAAQSESEEIQIGPRRSIRHGQGVISNDFLFHPNFDPDLAIDARRLGYVY